MYGTVFAFFIRTSKKKEGKEIGRMLAFCFFLIATCVFWTVYQLTPEVLFLFIAHNVDLTTAALFAVHIEDLAIHGQKLTNPLLTDPGCEKTFDILGLVTIAICIIMFIFRKKLCRMIDDTKVLCKSKISN